MDVTIRAATLGDEQRLAILNGFVQAVHLAKRPDHFKPAAEDEVVAWFRALLQDTSARVWIAEEGGAAVGYVLTIFQERAENPFCRSRRWCELDQIAVAPEFRRRRVASALVERALMSAAIDGYADVEVCTWCFNEEAQSVFSKHQFAPKFLRWERKNGSR